MPSRLPPIVLAAALAALAISPRPAAADVPLVAVGLLERAPGRIAVTPDGTVLVALHPYFHPDLKIARVVKGALVAYPNPVLGHGAGKGDLHLTAVTGLSVDKKGRVWILDAGGDGAPAKILEWDPKKHALARVIHLTAPAVVADSRPAGLAVDAEHHAVYVADPAGGDDAAIIVVDLATGRAHRELQGDVSVRPERMLIFVDGKPLLRRRANGEIYRPTVGVEALALDPSHTWLYFAALSSHHLYRVRTKALRRGGKGLSKKVDRFAKKPPCSGLAVDAKGNVYLGDVTRDAVGYLDPKGAFHELAYDRRLAWPGSLALGPKGDTLYVASSQLHRSGHYHAGRPDPVRPFYLFSLKLPGR